jgi:hypothetical protein
MRTDAYDFVKTQNIEHTPSKGRHTPSRQGFILAKVVIVLVVIGLLIGGMGNANAQTANEINTGNPSLKNAVVPAPSATESSDVYNLLWLLAIHDRSTLNIYYQRLLENLGKSKVPTAEMAKGAAMGYKIKHGGLLAQEEARIVALVPLGIDIPDFSKSSDLIWIVQFFNNIPKGVTQELWVSSTTGETRAMLLVPGKLK